MLRRLLALLATVALLAVAAWYGLISRPLFVAYGSSRGSAPLSAVLISGDMGLDVGMGGRIGRRLAAAGIPTVGVNAPSFFYGSRSSGAIAQLVEDAARRALTAHPGTHLILIGQSFGADILPIGVNRLSPDVRGRVGLVALIVPGREVYHGISAGEYFGFARPAAAGISEAGMIRDLPLLCIRGARERESLCPGLKGRNVRQAVLPGGHLLRRDADRLFATLAAAVRDVQMTKRS